MLPILVPVSPSTVRPMLATAAARLPVGPDWSYEFKWDGVRALLDVRDGRVALTSRNGNDVTAAYPELVAQARELGDALLDGEIVAFAGGRPSFEALQARMHVRAAADARRLAVDTPVTFVVFDLLRRWGVDLAGRPLAERRATLARFAAEHPDWTVSPAFDDGPATEAAAREHGLEGVMAKRLDSPYRAGVRSSDWRKLRFTRAGDFVVVGWESARDSPDRLSSLVLATWSPDGPVLAGKAGSGLTGRSAAELQRRLVARPTPLVRPVPPPSPGRSVVWTEPQLVVEVEFSSWTTEGRLRHPVVRRVRDDKTVEEALGDV